MNIFSQPVACLHLLNVFQTNFNFDEDYYELNCVPPKTHLFKPK